MARFWSKSPTKLFLQFFLVLLLLAVIVTLVTNFILFSNREEILKLNNESGSVINAKNIWYIPPYFLSLQGLIVIEKDGPYPFLKAGIITARFSLKDLFIKRKLTLLKIRASELNLDFPRLRKFLKDNYRQSLDFISLLPKVEKAIFEFPKIRFDKFSGNNNLNANFKFWIDGDLVRGEGKFQSDGLLFINQPTEFIGQGRFIQSGMAIESFELFQENAYLKLWGDWSAQELSLQGFSFLNDFFAPLKNTPEKKEPPANLFSRIGLMWRSKPVSPSLIELSKDDLNIFDINAKIRLSFPEVKIRQLNFSLNNIPVQSNGSIWLIPQPSMQLYFSSKNINSSLAGTIKDSAFNGALEVLIDNDDSEVKSQEKVKITTDRFSFSLKEWPYLKFRFDQGDFYYSSDNKNYEIALNDLKSSLFLGNRRYKTLQFEGNCAGGEIKGEGKIDTAYFPFRSNFDVKLEGQSAQALSNAVEYFKKVEGGVSTTFTYSNYPEHNLDGALQLSKGVLNKLDFFQWLGDQFALPSLEKLNYDTFSLAYKITPEGVFLNDIDLKADKVKLSGKYGLRKDNFVSSRVTLTMDRELLEESDKFTKLLNLVGQDLKVFDFDFQISGPLETMNFQWKESEFKNKLKHSIPGFIERRIEKNVEEAIASIVAK